MRSHLPPSMPIDLISGTLGTISIQLPFPNLWSGDLTVKISDLDVGVCLKKANNKGKGRAFTSNLEAGKAMVDLESSLIDAADKALNRDKEGRELAGSIINEASSTSGPLNPSRDSSSTSSIEDQEEEKITVISSIVESLLQRLKVQVLNIRITLISESLTSRELTTTLELRIQEIHFDTDSSTSASAAQEASGSQSFSVQDTSRNVGISGIELWSCSPSRSVSGISRASREPASAHKANPSLKKRTSSEASSSRSSSGSESATQAQSNYMEMSSAIQDLRESGADHGLDQSVDSDAMYHSALDVRQQPNEDDGATGHLQDSGPQRQESSLRVSQNGTESISKGKGDSGPTESRETAMLLSLGDGEPLSIKLTTLRYFPVDSGLSHSADKAASSTVSEDLPSDEGRTRASKLKSGPAVIKPKETSLSVAIPPVLVCLDANQISAVLSVIQALTSDRDAALVPPTELEAIQTSHAQKASHKPFTISVEVTSVQVALIYDVTISSQRLGAERTYFFKSSESRNLSVGHVKFAIQEAHFRFFTDGQSGKSTIDVQDLSAFEYLDVDLIEHLRILHQREPRSTPKRSRHCAISRTIPLLVFDGDLKPQAERSTQHHVPDWRIDDPSKLATPRPSVAFRHQDGDPKLKGSQSSTSKQISGSGAIRAQIQFVDFDKMNAGTNDKKIESIRSELKPFHVFVDLSIVKRSLPGFTKITSIFDQRENATSEADEASNHQRPYDDLASSTSTILGKESPNPRSQAKLSNPELRQRFGPSVKISMDCALVTFRVRVPSKPNISAVHASPPADDIYDRLSDYLGVDARSGIMTLDLVSLRLDSAPANIEGAGRLDSRSQTPKGVRPSQGVRFDHTDSTLHGSSYLGSRYFKICSVKCQEMDAYIKTVSEDKSEKLMSIGKISCDLDDQSTTPELEAQPLAPEVTLKRRKREGLVSQTISIFVPSLRVNLSKSAMDSLFLLADDLTILPGSIDRSFQGWEKNDNLELIRLSSQEADASKSDDGQSRIPKSALLRSILTSSILSSDSDKTEKDGFGHEVDCLEVRVEEIQVVLEFKDHCERPKKDLSDGMDDCYKSLLMVGKTMNASLTSKKNLLSIPAAEGGVSDSTSLSSSISSLLIQDVLNSGEGARITSREIFNRTFKPSLTDRTIDPMISILFTSLSDRENNPRESRVEINLTSSTLCLTEDFRLASDLSRFLKSPEGAFENVEPNELTRISLKLKDSCIHLTPPNVAARGVVVIGRLLSRAKVVPNSPGSSIHYACADVAGYLIDRGNPEKLGRIVPKTGHEHWASLGYARLFSLDESKGSLILSSGSQPGVDVKISRVALRLMACADTLSTVGEIVKDLSDSSNKEGKRERASSDSSTSDLRDSTIASKPGKSDSMTISIDENAFKRPTSAASSVPDLLEDDIPTNAAFLGTPTNVDIIETPLDGPEFFGDDESVASPSTAPRDSQSDKVMLATESVTVRLLDPAGIRPKSLYFARPNLRPQAVDSSNPISSNFRVRITGCDISLGMFGGYDWASTRDAIEEEARKVRRRLQKIKQLVAEGQRPDDTVEQATATLFESIHISLPQNTREMEAGEVMRLMDEEIDGDQSETASSASTWQRPLTHIQGLKNVKPPSSSQKKRKSKLRRSRVSMIDIDLKSSEVEFDSFDSVQSVTSRIQFSASTLEIIDNLKTSTWRTFLTSMPPEGSAYRRNAEAKMIKVEIKEIKPEKNQSRVETRMRAKIEPLRLHVDQDALDFLKKFFAFSAPGSIVSASTPSKETSPFIQHAEIYPIRLRLDYKPKRVDYNLLREGKTIELMNFFHFDNAEMTLRHVTLRGITGWTRLFDTLNGIWTPDIKANQLADVLSGVAPIRSLVNVGTGVADLVLLPIEQYQKDGRLLRGVQKGATSFTKNTMLEAVKLGARLATGTQVMLEKAEHVLGGSINDSVQAEAIGSALSSRIVTNSLSREGRSSLRGGDGRDDDEDETAEIELDQETLKEVISKYADQPEDMKEALNQAYRGLSKGFSAAAQTILAVPMEVYERGGGEGGAHPVVRAVPIAVLRGAMGASEAVSKTLMGVKNSLDPTAQREIGGKYKRSTR